MRITASQKRELDKILEGFGLNLSDFNFTGDDELYKIKYNHAYFDFEIVKENNLHYRNTVSYIHNKKAITTRDTWESTLKRLKSWANGIADEKKNQPKSYSKQEHAFPKEIHRYSKSFVTIYNQSLTAEMNGLSEICGLGYRKAFEFLIKEYLIKKHPDTEHAKIKELPVSQCIQYYVSSDEIKLLSHRVLWLGNDHAHYIKKWKGKTLNDLKSLIQLAIKWILIKDELIKVEKKMPGGKK